MKKKIKKRWIILVLTVVMISSIVPGCGKKAEDKDEKGSGFELPDTKITKMIPDPKSDYGELTYSSDEELMVNILKYSKDNFKSYIKECAKSGFNVEAVTTETSYDAKNNDGYELSIYYYDDDKEMDISVSKPKTSEESENNDTSDTTEDTQTDSSTVDNSTIRPEIKEAIDSYESFMNDYVEFMKKYDSADDTSSLMTQYTDFMSKYSDVESKFDDLEYDDLTDAETNYYTEVQARVANKLLEIGE